MNSSRDPAMHVYLKSPFLSLCRGLGQGDMGNLRPGNKGKLSEKPPFNPSVPDWGKTELPEPCNSLQQSEITPSSNQDKHLISQTLCRPNAALTGLPYGFQHNTTQTQAKPGNSNKKRTRIQPFSRQELLFPLQDSYNQKDWGNIREQRGYRW